MYRLRVVTNSPISYCLRNLASGFERTSPVNLSTALVSLLMTFKSLDVSSVDEILRLCRCPKVRRLPRPMPQYSVRRGDLGSCLVSRCGTCADAQT